MRDNAWLEEKMYKLWEDNFSEVPRQNKVTIKFGKRAYQTLGSIKYSGKLTQNDHEYKVHDDKRITQITITRYFADEKVPEKVVIGTIAHEMVHYAHGFHSPLKQQYKYPHQGSLIKKEMENRGLTDIYEFSKRWVKNEWPEYIKSLGIKTRTHRRRYVRYIRKKDLVSILFNF